MDPILPILPLPADAVAQIKSSITITSLNTVVVELLKNSLDAQSSRIDITVEYFRGNCTVEDDGFGIQPPEFKQGGGLGKLHHSSKHDNTAIAHGSRGALIASVAALSMVSITSHHYLHNSQNSLTINRSQVIARQIPAPSQQHVSAYKHGTRVSVRDLFGNIPVRVKRRNEESSRLSGGGRDWDELRRLITSLVLAWPSPVTVVARDAVSGQKFQLRRRRHADSATNLQSDENFVADVCNILFQALFITSPDKSRWVSATASTPKIQIRGAISLEPAPTKAVQFLSLNIEPLYAQYGHGILYDEINKNFESSSFGTEAESIDSDITEPKKEFENSQSKSIDFTVKEPKGTRKRLDRWPMFFIKIEFSDPISHRVDNATDDLIEDRKGSLTSVIELLRVVISEFLRRHHFRLKPVRHAHGQQNRNPGVAESMPKSETGPRQGWNSIPRSQKRMQLKRISSPFDGWSRVKSGRPKLGNSIPEQVSEQKISIIQDNPKDSVPRDCLSNTSFCSQTGFDPHNPGLEYDNLTISQSGKVVRPPFSDVNPVTPKTINSSSPSENMIRISDRNETTGELALVSWVNPITNKESLINRRTGLVANLPKTERLTPCMRLNADHGKKCALPTIENIASSKAPDSTDGSSTWIQAILGNWNNPIYCPRETGIPRLAGDDSENESQQLLRGNRHLCSQTDIDRAFRQSSTNFHGQLSKENLRYAEVISQVDNKFIIIKIATGTASSSYSKASSEILVIVDQHAADERYRIEELLKEICCPPVLEERFPSTASFNSAVLTAQLEPPISFTMPLREIQLLQTHSRHFANWGITYDVPSSLPTIDSHGEYTLSVKSLPPSIAERCKTVPRLLVELLRSEAWICSEKEPQLGYLGADTDDVDTLNKHPWLNRIHSCPKALLEMLNSRACRSAIMFNDELSLDQCTALISRLADCAFPFQCAHGRPSMVPLVNLQSFSEESLSNTRAITRHEGHFGASIKKWKQERLGATKS